MKKKNIPVIPLSILIVMYHKFLQYVDDTIMKLFPIKQEFSHQMKPQYYFLLIFSSWQRYLGSLPLLFPTGWALAIKEHICPQTGSPDTLFTRIASYSCRGAGLATDHLTMKQVPLVNMIPVGDFISLLPTFYRFHKSL